MRKSKDCGCHYPIQHSSKLPQLEASRYVFFYHDFSPEEKKIDFCERKAETHLRHCATNTEGIEDNLPT